MADVGGTLKRQWGRLWNDDDLEGPRTDRTILSDDRHHVCITVVPSRLSVRGVRRDVEAVAEKLGLQCEIVTGRGLVFLPLSVTVTGPEAEVDRLLGWVRVSVMNGFSGMSGGGGPT